MEEKELKEMFEKKMEIKYDDLAEEYPSLIKACKNVLDEYRISDFVNVYDCLNHLYEFDRDLKRMDENRVLSFLDDHFHLRKLIIDKFFRSNIYNYLDFNSNNLINYKELIKYIDESYYIDETPVRINNSYRFSIKEIVEMIQEDKNNILNIFFMEHFDLMGEKKKDDWERIYRYKYNQVKTTKYAVCSIEDDRINYVKFFRFKDDAETVAKRWNKEDEKNVGKKWVVKSILVY